VRVRRIAPVDLEATTVAAIVDGAFGFYGGPYWQWKYADPGGPDAVIMLAEEGAEIVGCNHYLVVPYQLGEHTLTGLAGGDLFVNPEFRRQHIATDLSLESRMLVTEAHPEADFVVMFTWQALGSHYEKLLGYTKLEPGYQQWSKRLSWEPQLARLTEANEGLLTKHPGLARANHALRLEVKGAPPLDLKVGPEGFTPGGQMASRRCDCEFLARTHCPSDVRACRWFGWSPRSSHAGGGSGDRQRRYARRHRLLRHTARR
jgi:hypothetical protein